MTVDDEKNGFCSAALMDAYRRLMPRKLPGSAEAELRQLEEKLGTEGCIRGLERAAAYGAKSWSYVREVLQGKVQEQTGQDTGRFAGFQTHDGPLSPLARKAVARALAASREEAASGAEE